MEQKLIAGCIRQERSAQRQLYERYSSRMFAVCLRYAKDRDSALDILQDGFIAVFSKLESYKNEGSFEGWMRKIFVNTALMSLRKHDLLKNAEDIDAPGSDIPVDANILERMDGHRLMKLISQMPVGFRTVFNLSVIDGFSHQEIAQKLNISEGASRSQLSRARVWLQERIKKMEK
jgi:RNA polymerase sigma-70 factor (ECF subfamily)